MRSTAQFSSGAGEPIPTTPLSFLLNIGEMSSKSWDPAFSSDWDKESSSPMCIKRVTNDIRGLLEEESTDGFRIFVVPDEKNITKMQALIIGPSGTPYEDGFFQFYLRVSPQSYPIIPPRVKILTTGDGRVRFGPNLYAEGKVCLSILGTFSGPSWSPAMTLSGVLKSIQSLMSDCAMRNEPSLERLPASSPDVQEYDRMVRHETYRIAVIDCVKKAMQADSTIPLKFRKVILKHFMEAVDEMIKRCGENVRLDGKGIQIRDHSYGLSHFGTSVHMWGSIASELKKLKMEVPPVLKSLDSPQVVDDDMEIM